MDALEFLMEHKRMCNEYSRSYNGCCDCPLISRCSISSTASDDDNKKTVDVVEQWSKEHPRKTRQSVFLEQWPDAKVFVDGVIDLCPQELNSHYPCQSTDYKMRCQTCRREFWMQEVE